MRREGGFLHTAKVGSTVAELVDVVDATLWGEHGEVRRAGSGDPCEAQYASWMCVNPACKNAGVPVDRRLKCDDERLCPECSKVWAAGEARAVGWRFAHAGKGDRFPRHFVVSFDAQEPAHSPATYRDTFSAAWALLKALGARGAALVYHGWRHASTATGTVWRTGPHVHALVVGPVNVWSLAGGARVQDIELRHGRERTEIVPTVAYLLDHCGVVPGRHAVRWYGSMSYNRLQVPSDPEAKLPRCEFCDHPLERVDGICDYTGGLAERVGRG